MIIKSISTKSAGNLIKYIFREKALPMRSFSRFREQLKYKAEKDMPVYIAGKLLSKSDVKYLIAELNDKQLHAAAKNYKGTREEFIKEYLMAKGSVADMYKKSQPFVVTKNLRTKTVEGFIREFEQSNERRMYKSKDMVEAQHIILSWHEADAAKLTDAKLKAMAREFIRLHGEDKLYCGTAHHDKGHTHIHLAVSGTRLDGMSSRVSKVEFARIKKEMTLFQEKHFPELSNSLPEHGKKSRISENKNIKTAERNNVRSPLLQYLDESYNKAASLNHFLAQLKERNIEPYERGGKMTGVVAEGYKFRFSRLGYDLDRLQELDAKKSKSDAALKELGNIRNRGKEAQKSKENTSELTGTLKELAEIRSAAVEKENDRKDDNDLMKEAPDKAIAADVEDTDDTDALNADSDEAEQEDTGTEDEQ
ncbi:hypothetical protein CJD36_004545 [Flavipsychrobacter stenotrophus]|uniref:MobA/VirD2-like nuclease domain-containing protein n=1 Tax=Flavipsychrobacter stenotrophus TaxID=2077091 RepID=A0A2S7T261_9BACT|nr:relaxase/mobilization nuclease domain-containing protein [Flavipsychrobacter stenotrophus]PQJ13018.1 hypothetical protein CJD36_004545 [Flavipsychrobacter stenotrophus]